jgi:hypothetical protein
MSGSGPDGRLEQSDTPRILSGDKWGASNSLDGEVR